MYRVVVPMVIAAASSVLSACGTTYSMKEFAPTSDGPKSVLIDIKQRAILSGTRASEGEARGSNVAMCAEPSPDALSSLASEFALDTKVKDSIAATLGYSQQEAASFVGLRTQTIQLLRDGMFRLCEGYLSGALSAADYAWLSRRYQRNMVTLLTIEQLTRVAQVPAVAQASQGLASASRSAAAIRSDLEQIDQDKARLEDEKKKLDADLAEAEKLPDTDTSKSGKVAKLKKAVADKQAAIARADEVRTAMLEGLKSARGVLASGSTTVQIVNAGQDARTVSDKVAERIATLAERVLDQDDLPTLCFQLLDGSRPASKADPELKNICKGVVARRNSVTAP